MSKYEILFLLISFIFLIIAAFNEYRYIRRLRNQPYRLAEFIWF
ncbi:MAG: hypothetical protein WBA71_04605 [Candidatus Humimicrobiia bacterium]